MINVLTEYSSYCKSKNIPFQECNSIQAYDDSTLFCSAGMQQYKKEFANKAITGLTIANSQKILRTNDLDNIGDGFHFAYFSMLGLFSFRDWFVERAIKFWLGFIQEKVGLPITKVTIHPDLVKEAQDLYSSANIKLCWVKGHDVSPQNKLVDEEAKTEAILCMRRAQNR